MQTALLVAIVISSALTGLGKYRSRVLHYIFKPLTTLLILALALWAGVGHETGTYRWLIAVGLIFSLAGDVFLMLPRDRFIAGLASFLVAHLIYIAAFTLHGLHAPLWLWLAAIAAALGGMAMLLPGAGKLRLPVACYSSIIAVMALTAVSRALQLDTLGASLAAAGALLFMLSDSLLGFNRFVKPFAAAEALLLSTYFAGQALIALSV